VADLISAVDIEWPYMLAKSARQMQCDACGQWIQPGGQLFHTDLSAGVTFCRWCAYREVRVNRPDLIRAVWWHESLLSDKAQSVIEASGGSRRGGQLMRGDASLGNVTVCADGTVVLIAAPLSPDVCGGFSVYESLEAVRRMFDGCEFVEDL